MIFLKAQYNQCLVKQKKLITERYWKQLRDIIEGRTSRKRTVSIYSIVTTKASFDGFEFTN